MKKVLLSLCILVFFSAHSQINHLKANLLFVTPTGNLLVDGNDVVFDDAYSDSLDDYDVLKFSNINENFGVIRDTNIMVIETRKKTFTNDTIKYKLWNVIQAQYQFEFTPYNFATPNLTATFHDCFLNADMPLDCTMPFTYSFAVTADSASSLPCRFYVVLNVANLLSETFTSANAVAKDNRVLLSWTMANQQSINQYQIERSLNGHEFAGIGTTGNASCSTYNWIDETPVSGANYYRVKSIGASGKINYTTVMKVLMNNTANEYGIFPNPVTGGHFNLHFANSIQGDYAISLLNNSGQTCSRISVTNPTGICTQTISLPASARSGTYQLMIVSPEKKRAVKAIVVRTK